MSLECTKIVDGIKAGGKIRDRTIDHIYKQFFHLVRSTSTKFGLDYAFVFSEYSDTILVFDDYVRSGRFEIRNENSCLSFIMRTLELKCLNLGRRESRRPEAPLDPENYPSLYFEKDEIESNPLMHKLLQAFHKLDGKCQHILMGWASGLKMEEIAEENELGNANSATVSKHRCFKKLKKILGDEGYV